MKCFVFAYGTLLDSAVRETVLGYTTTIKASQVVGFRKEEIILSGIAYPILVEDILCKETIEGGYFEIDKVDLTKLDAYESSAYKRKQVTTAEGIRVWIYYL
jgi:gamma-glutamylcyclotransferase (GGCT)/AIG2-like uncharacterized protein YtfP